MIGITGKSGSGKSTLADTLAGKLNCVTINVDKIGHEDFQDFQDFVDTFSNNIILTY